MTERKWNANKETGGSYTRLLSDFRLNIKIYPHLRCSDFCSKRICVFYSFFWTSLAAFTVSCLEDYYEKDQCRYFWGNLKPVLGVLVSSMFNKKEWFLIVSFGVVTRFSGTVLCCLHWWKLSSCHYF